MLSILDIVVYLLIGTFTGITIGLVGIGAGILFIPLLVSYGIPVKAAVAVGLALQVVPQSLPGLYLYYKKGLVNIPVIIWCIIGSTIGIFIGSYLSTKGYISELWIYRILFFIVLFTAIYIGIKYTKFFPFKIRYSKEDFIE